MRNILSLVLEESEKIPTEILEVILKNLLKTNKVSSLKIKTSWVVSHVIILATFGGRYLFSDSFNDYLYENYLVQFCILSSFFSSVLFCQN